MAEDDEEELKRRIIVFLTEMKSLVRTYGLPALLNRPKDRQGFVDSGHTQQTFLDDILRLQLSDYSEGPLTFENHPGENWVFGKVIARHEFYIRLKIIEFSNGHREAVCTAFHRAGKPLAYPFKKTNK